MTRREPRVWSVYDPGGRLAATLAEEPGQFNFAQMPEEDAGSLDIPWASLRCYSAPLEPELLGLVTRSEGLEDFFDALRTRRYRVVEGRPRPRTFARL